MTWRIIVELVRLLEECTGRRMFQVAPVAQSAAQYSRDARWSTRSKSQRFDGARRNDANAECKREVGGRPQGRTRFVHRPNGTWGAIQLQLAIREWDRLESRGAARRGRSGVLQHGALRGAREKRHGADVDRDEGGVYDREGRRTNDDHED